LGADTVQWSLLPKAAVSRVSPLDLEMIAVLLIVRIRTAFTDGLPDMIRGDLAIAVRRSRCALSVRESPGTCGMLGRPRQERSRVVVDLCALIFCLRDGLGSPCQSLEDLSLLAVEFCRSILCRPQGILFHLDDYPAAE
jgi:hypothetical protein